MNTAAAADSSSGIFEAEEKESGVSVLSMPIVIEGETHYKGKNLSHDTWLWKFNGDGYESIGLIL